MNDSELGELEALWRGASDPETEVAAIGERAVHRARMVQTIEIVAAVLIGVSVVAVLALNPSKAVLTSGGLILMALVWSAWSRHRLSGEMLRAHGQRDYVTGELAARRAALRRSGLGLVLAPPGILLMIAMVEGAQTGVPFRHVLPRIPEMLLTPTGMVAGALTLLMFVHLGLEHRRLRGEAARLEALAGAYAREDARDDAQSSELLLIRNG